MSAQTTTKHNSEHSSSMSPDATVVHANDSSDGEGTMMFPFVFPLVFSKPPQAVGDAGEETNQSQE